MTSTEPSTTHLAQEARSAFDEINAYLDVIETVVQQLRARVEQANRKEPSDGDGADSH